MVAVFINSIAVIVGSCIGLLVKKRISGHFRSVVFSASGLVTLIIGISMALGTQSYLIMIFSVALGGMCGYALRIEDHILSLGDKFQKHPVESVSTEEEGKQGFGFGFLTASVLFCSGAMAVVGSIDVGVRGDYSLIMLKSVMDGAMAIILAAAYGSGVMASAISIFVYQGFFTVAGSWLEPLMGEKGIAELAAVGGVLLLMIGFNLLEIKKFKTGNFLPALILAPIFTAVSPWLSGLFGLS
ncbi:DUF554 domain-containing protein [Parasphaerochaeta coccoides]|uniref:Transport protein n=1 Tax=Parasphaerochaeta coccoides (strain ATCC BAA-1237 / DSM 17374 / SPN1) TaxID=760011 RepID=F4GKR0_PARC1|nr:DUF554 domain-containing protein [Parasphaerochaeta coccoides]AEC01469.1 protein of unknown function DUF554 [Parasphaerochaeta coccoides DSM 17374]